MASRFTISDAHAVDSPDAHHSYLVGIRMRRGRKQAHSVISTGHSAQVLSYLITARIVPSVQVSPPGIFILLAKRVLTGPETLTDLDY